MGGRGALPVQGGEEAAGAQQQRPPGQHRAPLVDPVQVAPGHVRHPDGARGAVEKLVSVPERDRTFTLAAARRGLAAPSGPSIGRAPARERPHAESSAVCYKARSRSSPRRILRENHSIGSLPLPLPQPGRPARTCAGHAPQSLLPAEGHPAAPCPSHTRHQVPPVR